VSEVPPMIAGYPLHRELGGGMWLVAMPLMLDRARIAVASADFIGEHW
jgi:hypothetical protein